MIDLVRGGAWFDTFANFCNAWLNRKHPLLRPASALSLMRSVLGSGCVKRICSHKDVGWSGEGPADPPEGVLDPDVLRLPPERARVLAAP